MRPVSTLPVPVPLEEPTDAEALSALSKDQLADRLTTWAGRIAAGEARILLYLGEFDERNGWSGVGMLSCAQWLSWKLGMGLKAAGERVRIAKALRTLPRIRAAFTAGRLSYSQVRALTRISTADNEHIFLDTARHASGGQLERLVGGIRRAQAIQDRAEAKKAAAAGSPPPPPAALARTRYDADGNFVLTLTCPAEQATALLAALDAARSDVDSSGESSDAQSSAEDATPPARASLADAVLRLAHRYLDVRAHDHPAKVRRDRAKLTVNIDPLSGWARLPDGELLPPGTLDAVSLPRPRQPLRPLGPDELTRHDSGRGRREATQALRDLLGTLDGEHCRYPGCQRRRKLHAHHVIWWSNGGPTDLANLVLLCSRHHTLVHRDGIQLVLHPHTRALQVATQDGTAVPHRPPLPWRPAAEIDPLGTIGAKTLPPEATDRLNLHYAVSVLLQWAA